MTDHPLAAPIDRALGEFIWEDGVAREELLRDILAAIEAEFGPISVEYERGTGLVAEKQRLSGEWVPKR